MMMHNPPHPGKVLRELWFEPIGITVTEAAQRLGVSRKALSELLNGHTGISAEMAVRLSKALGTSSDVWMNMQAQYALWHAEQRREELEVREIAAA